MEGNQLGIEIAGLQDDFCFWICGDEFGSETDARSVCYGSKKENASSS